MPIHKVSGGYKWGGHGHVYPSKKGARRQAAAAYAHGYKGKSMDASVDLANDAVKTLLEMAAGVYGDKTYISPNEIDSVPSHFTIYRGPKGGMFYYHDGDPARQPKAVVVRAASPQGANDAVGSHQGSGADVSHDTVPEQSIAPKREKRRAPSEVLAVAERVVSNYVPQHGGDKFERYREFGRLSAKVYSSPEGRAYIDRLTGMGTDFYSRQNMKQTAKGRIDDAVYDVLENMGKLENMRQNPIDMAELDAIQKGAADIYKRNRDPEHTSLRGPDKTKEEHFAVKRDDAGKRMKLPAERIYITEEEEAPPGAFVQEGPRGGRYYVGDPRTLAPSGEDENEGAGSMGSVVDQPDENPDRIVKPKLGIEQETEGPESDDTLAKLKRELANHQVDQATRIRGGEYTPGYEINDRAGKYEVHARGGSTDEVKKVMGSIVEAVEDGEFTYSKERDHVLVEPIGGADEADSLMPDFRGDSNGIIQALGDIVDPIEPLDVTRKAINETVQDLSSMISLSLR